MVWHSVALMTALDCLTVVVAGSAVIFFVCNAMEIHAANVQAAAIVLFFGVCILGVFHLANSITIHIFPMFMPLSKAMSLMNFLQVNLSGLVHAVSLACIVLGSLSVIRRMFPSREKGAAAIALLDEQVTELTTRNDRFCTALDNMSQGLCMFDGDQRLTVCNDRYASMYGLSPDQVKPGKTLREILECLVDNNIFSEAAREDYIQERLATAVERVPAVKIQELGNGSSISIAYQPLADGGWVATHEDVTELKEAESLNLRLAQIVENAINEVYVFDAGTLTYEQANASACENLGYTIEEMRELTPVDLNPEFTTERFEELVAPLRRRETSHVRFEAVHRRKDGSDYDVGVILQYIPSQSQSVFAAIVEDITERKKADAALRESEMRFRTFVRHSPSSISMKALDRTYLLVNPKHVEFFGRSEDDVIGNKPEDLYASDYLDFNRSFDSDVLEAGQPVEREENVRVGNRTKTLLTVKFPIADVNGQTVGIGAIATDITDRKHAEQELADHRDHLQELVNAATRDLREKAEQLKTALASEKELNELQREFVSMASHEFRTPLAIIDSTAQRLKRQVAKDSLAPEVASQSIDKIRGAVRRMTRLMESTLCLARMEEGKIAVTIGPCDVANLVSEVCGRQQEIAETHVVSCDLADLPDTIRADGVALDQILTNLLSNAVKYAPGAPNIEVRSRTIGDDVAISVRDHGLGIDADDLPRMFSRFFRAKTSAGIAGTGIGLHMVKTLVEMHDGSVAVESQKGEGTTFTVRLPVAGPDRTENMETRAA